MNSCERRRAGSCTVRRGSRFAWLWPVLLVFTLSAASMADTVSMTRITLTEREPGTYVLDADFPPLMPVAAPRIDLPPRFTWSQTPEIVRTQDRPRVRAAFACSTEPLTPDDELFVHWVLDGAFVVARWHDGTVRTGYMPGDRMTGVAVDMAVLMSITPSTRELVTEFVGRGFRHALTMPVHVVLALAVVLVAGTRSTLILLLAGSAGQAVGLALTEITGAGLPMAPVDACIAFAAVIIAQAGLRGMRDADEVNYRVILFALGVLHALAAADQLRPEELHGLARVQAIFAFGVGVDLAHYAIWLVLVGVAAVITSRPALAPVRTVARFGTGALAVALIAVALLPAHGVDDSASTIRPPDRLGASLSGQSPRRASASSTGKGLKDPCMSFMAIELFEVRHEVLFRFDAIAPIIDAEANVADWVEVDQQSRLLQAALDELVRGCVLRIDGEVAEPAVRHVAFAEVTDKGTTLRSSPLREQRDEAVIAITLAYLTAGLPSNVSIEWDLFGEQVPAVPLTMTDPINVEQARLSPDAPSFQWINKLHGYAVPTVEAVALTRPRLPVTSVAMALMAIVLVGRRRWNERKTTLSPVAAALLVTAVLAYPFVRPALAIPLLGQPRLAPDQAADVLAQLLTNVYRAFDHRDEDAVFDRLALTVSGDALTEVYLENRRMLALENRGGARVRVSEVRVDGVDEVIPRGAGSFEVMAAWTVSGSVTHFGHTHFRTNAYRALVTIAADDDTWKLAAVDLHDEQRTR